MNKDKQNDKRRKKVIVIGAGISGMSAAIYLLDNGFDVEIYEKHIIPGGECTGWMREGVEIDGCAHWIVGTHKESQLYPLWHHIGALTDDTKIYDTDYFNQLKAGDETLTVYSDLKKLEAELLRFGPEDRKEIRRFIRHIKAYQHVHIPMKKPIDMMNLWELTMFGIHFLPMLPTYLWARKVRIEDYAERFASPHLKTLFRNIMMPNYNMHALLYTMQALSRSDGGVMEGGSKKMALRIAETVRSKGGIIHLGKPVNEILVEGDKAVGIRLENGEVVHADDIVASTDIHHLLYDLLGHRYVDPFYESRFANPSDYPLNPCLYFAFKTKADLTDKAKVTIAPIAPIAIGEGAIKNLYIRNHSFDQTMGSDATSITVLTYSEESIYSHLKSLSHADYLALKKEVGEKIRRIVADQLALDESEVTLIDVATPLTYERYCNAYHGSYMSFLTTKDSKGLLKKGTIKGLKHLVVAGQWLMPPGGLPIAAFTGKHAAYRVCREYHLKFIDESAGPSLWTLLFARRPQLD